MKCVHGRIPHTTDDALYNTALLKDIPLDMRVLDLRWVPLHTLDISHLQELEELYLHENELHVLEESIGELPKIRVLSLGRNNIHTLPTSIKKTWVSLRRLILGDNHIHTLPFHEDDMILEHGSIGNNPLPEPVGACWMFRKDALQSVTDLRNLLRPAMRVPSSIEESNIAIAIDICRALDEPMIYEELYRGYSWTDGAIVHPDHNYPLERKALTHLLPSLRPDVLLEFTLAEQVCCH